MRALTYLAITLAGNEILIGELTVAPGDTKETCNGLCPTTGSHCA
jgi:hypothetical protein